MQNSLQERGDLTGNTDEYYAPLGYQAIRAYMGRGYAAVQLQRHARAVADYKAALALDANNAYARNALKDLGEP